MAAQAIPLDERFRRNIVESETGCWIWQAGTGPDGYSVWIIGSVLDGSRHSIALHRWSYERFKGPIPEGLQIDHLCRVRNCVNPDHLEAVTQSENVRRGYAARLSPYCKQGHLRAIYQRRTSPVGKYPNTLYCLECCRLRSVKTNARRRQKAS